MNKRRSDIAKLVTRAREIWRQSVNYQKVKRESRDPNRVGWFICSKCRISREVIRIDHIVAIGRQPDNFMEFGPWLDRLFNFEQQGLCVDCHKIKTKEDRRKLRGKTCKP